jgi:hypothetical protein
MTFEKSVEITPAFDRRNDDTHKNYGIHGVDMKFLLKGPKGVIQFALSTNWHLPNVNKELQAGCSCRMHCFMEPMATDIGYHSYVPIHEDQHPISQSCPYLEGKPCYYDGSSLQAQEIFDIMVSQGGDAMWAEMESRYKDLFGDET